VNGERFRFVVIDPAELIGLVGLLILCVTPSWELTFTR
jgi:hypothetical protein